MDTTETYIKMCSKAEEIQGQWQPQIGDYVGGEWFIDNDDTIGLCYKGIIKRLNPEGKSDCVDTGGNIFWCIKSHIWLPRQDQLQEMVDEEDKTLVGSYEGVLLDRFVHFCYLITAKDIDSGFVHEKWEKKRVVASCRSMEQLWLAFVRSEKYNKVWDGENWIVVLKKS